MNFYIDFLAKTSYKISCIDLRKNKNNRLMYKLMDLWLFHTLSMR